MSGTAADRLLRGIVNLRLILILVGVVAVGLTTKVYSGPGAPWIRAHFGGALYVMFFTFVALAVRPKCSSRLASAVVLAAVFGIEFLQLWHPPVLETIRSTRIGHLLLGSTFSWFDFPYYVAGAVASAFLARWVTPPRVERAR